VSILIQEIRRAPSKWFFPLVGLGIIGICVLGLRPGVLTWGDATAGIARSAVAINPLLAGVFAWAAGRRKIAGFSGRTTRSERRPSVPYLIYFGALVFWPLVGAVVALLLLLAAFSVFGADGAPVWPWIAASASGTLAMCAFGFLVGSLIGQFWYVSPAVVIVTYLGLVASNAAKIPYWAVQLYPTTLNETNPFVRYIIPTFWAQVAWYTALFILFLALLPVGRNAGAATRLIAIAAAVCLGATGVITIQTTRGQVTEGFNARDYSCLSAPVNICVQKAFKSGLPGLENSFAAFNDKVANSRLVATRLEHNVMGQGDVASRGARSLYLEDLSPDYAQASLTNYIYKYDGFIKCVDERSRSLHSIVESWLIGQPNWLETADGPEGDASRKFAALTEPARHDWFVAHEANVLSCQLSLADFS
jgi:hypothetical protein